MRTDSRKGVRGLKVPKIAQEVIKNDIVECMANMALVKKGVIGRVIDIDGNLALVKIAGNEAVIWSARYNWRKVGTCQGIAKE
jgi:hypothetical protein